MNKLLLPLREYNITYYLESGKCMFIIIIEGDNGGIYFEVIAEDNQFNVIRSVEIHASVGRINSRENYFEKDVLKELILAITENKVYLQKAKKRGFEDCKQLFADWKTALLSIVFWWVIVFGTINDNLYIMGVNCTQEEVDKMKGLVRLDLCSIKY